MLLSPRFQSTARAQIAAVVYLVAAAGSVNSASAAKQPPNGANAPRSFLAKAALTFLCRADGRKRQRLVLDAPAHGARVRGEVE